MKKIYRLQIIYGLIINKFENPKNNVLKTYILRAIFVSLLLSSCYSSKKLDYIQTDSEKVIKKINPSDYLVQAFDILNIKVQTKDPEQSAFFNLNSANNGNVQADPALFFISGYTVSRRGTINMATVGEVQVVGLTVDQIRDLVQNEIDKQLLNAKVLVNLTSFKISVLGDVKNPGTNYVYNAQSTLFEALSAAGDLNISGKRKNIKLIRQIDRESTIVVNLDLTDPDIIESPYYFLNPNDVIYVDTSKPNIFRNNLGIITTVLATISTGVLVWSFISNETDR